MHSDWLTRIIPYASCLSVCIIYVYICGIYAILPVCVCAVKFANAANF